MIAPAPSIRPAGPKTRPQAAWRPIRAALLCGLGGQYLLGLGLNFWFTLPAHHPGLHATAYLLGVARLVAWSLAGGTAPLTLYRTHVTLGLLIGLGALALLVIGIVGRRATQIWTAAIGLVGVAAAGLGGASFANYGHDVSSLLMGSGWLLALGAYALARQLPA